DPAGAAGHEHADASRLGVLDDVRQRLLDNAKEGGLDLAGQPLDLRRRFQLDADSGRLLERLGETLERRHEAEVLEHLRPKLEREPTHVLERRDDALAQLGRSLPCRLAALGLLDRLQTEKDRRQRLARLVVELAREAAALELLGLDDAAEDIAAHARRQVD